MNKKLFFLVAATSLTVYSKAQNSRQDSLVKEAAKTEIWSPEPKIVTPGATPQDAPSDAIILFNGKNIADIPDEQLRKMRKDIQIIFQDPFGSLNPRLTIGQAINEPMKIHEILPTEKQRKEKIIELLEKVDLKPEFFNRYPHEFSGGQRQRICIARALGLNPDFIICDESVSALDVSVQAQVLNLLNDLKEELGFTCIFISHDLGVVHYISNRIMVMNRGKIEETGTADEIYYHPKKEYTQRLIASIPTVNF